ncbi:asparagine synthase (glutamine-hydrolyzing) [Thermoactinomyces sp. Gus2-1]|jgi:asparagine synthase (glutamine-hydrolysing)|uniref:asparagine synthase (glutamine-hydrolyzing) n=1 Tax=Thermoactinomyces sp. Gus2-1 TaxID=1535750 RepID=UPI000501C666|nr:asparagine synthase (glutamine-hydrolyzing) [Thermoactinomyces sp. Gus2-1]KFZ40100.1 asparagine synthase [Thermoactinomyces sp. Gus2-1]
MSGIAGWIDWERDLSGEQNVLSKMTNAIQHRGPDDEGYWSSERAAIGHRRLFVIDPAGGKQPMVYRSGDHSIVLSYDGFIYNFKDLKAELENLGHRFGTESDAEVLLHSYLEWGEDFIQRINGVFAFAIWDERRQALILARDRIGVKPLFYKVHNSGVLFGSELKAILAHPEVKPEVDVEGFSELFGMGPIRTPGFGVFRGIQEVKQGHYIVFTKEKADHHQYWKLESTPHEDDVDTTVEKIREILKDTVKRQLIADAPVVSMLSGGLDSSGLTSMAARYMAEEGKQLGTYSLDFAGSDKHFKADLLHVSRDEPFVKIVAEYANTDHHTVIINHDQLTEHVFLPVEAHDLPALGEMEASLHLLFSEMKKNAAATLSGESADEVFSGYPWFHQDEFLFSGTFPWSAQIRYFKDVLNEEAIKTLQPEEHRNRRYQEAVSEVPKLDGETGIEEKQREMSYLFITRFLPFMLERKDRISMHNSFEARVPFSDYRLVQYLFNIPYSMKTVDKVEKSLLRRAFKGYLPEEVRTRKKSAYPSTTDPIYYQNIRKMLNELIEDPQAPVAVLLDKQKIRHISDNLFDKAPFEVGKMMEYILQVNKWMKDYNISLKL